MPDVKTKPSEPDFFTLINSDTKEKVQKMYLLPRDAEILNKVFIKHKVPNRFVIEP